MHRLGKLNQLVSSVKSIEPRDEMESMLACQMAAIHDATMNMAGSLKRAEYVSTRSEAERSLNRLSRTFSMQMETLKKYRDDRTQKILVQHVNVEPGGQAVVGDIHQRGPGSKEKEGSTP